MATQNAIQRIGEIQKQLEFDVADIKKVESGKPSIYLIFHRVHQGGHCQAIAD
jgi:hypothetical protein